MTPFEMSLIQDAFEKCWGLKESFEKNQDDAITMLSELTGIRERYIIKNLDQILS